MKWELDNLGFFVLSFTDLTEYSDDLVMLGKVYVAFVVEIYFGFPIED